MRDGAALAVVHARGRDLDAVQLGQLRPGRGRDGGRGRRLRLASRGIRQRPTLGCVSWAWATLTCLNNAAWISYFSLEHYWTALVPSSSATALAGTLAILLCVQDRPRLRPSVPIAAWAAMLVAAYLILGRMGLGALLTAAFVVQVAPSIWTAYRTERPTGISAGTWLLILGELSCWLTFGLHKSDPRLITLGLTGVTASALMLARIRRTSRKMLTVGLPAVLDDMA